MMTQSNQMNLPIIIHTNDNQRKTGLITIGFWLSPGISYFHIFYFFKVILYFFLLSISANRIESIFQDQVLIANHKQSNRFRNDFQVPS